MKSNTHNEVGTFLCPDGVDGPLIKIDTMSEEERRLLIGLLESHLRVPEGSWVLVLRVASNEEVFSDAVVAVAGQKGVELSSVKHVDGEWLRRTAKRLSNIDAHTVEEGISALDEVQAA